MSSPLFQLHRFDAGEDTTLQQSPFPFLVASGQLPSSAQAGLIADFPCFGEAGFFPYEPDECGASLRALVEELTSPAFADALGARLGLPGLGAKPTLVTLCRSLNRRHGTIHTDSRAKLATALLYLQPDWPATSDGCLRYLAKADDIDAVVAPEIRPVYGTLTAFKRTDNSFHGHLPHEGERLVVQVAWLTSENEKRRKTARGRFSRWLKSVLGGLDQHWGARRSRNAAHRD